MNTNQPIVVERIARKSARAVARRIRRRGLQWELQNMGSNRFEARRTAFGRIRSTPNMTRGQLQNQAIAARAAFRRWRRRQAVASSIAVAEASW